MKRILVIAVLAVFVLSLSAFAAEGGKKMPMTFGIKAGVSLGNASGDSLLALAGAGGSKSMLAGFLAGAVYSFEPVKGFAIQPEIFYVQKGVKITNNGLSAKFKVDYLEVPVLAKWLPQMKDSKIQPTIFAGPFLGLLMSSKEEAPDGTTTDVKDSTKSTDFGITFGAGLGYKMTKGELFLDARYDLGLTKVQKALSNGTQFDTKTTAIMIAVGYKFDI